MLDPDFLRIRDIVPTLVPFIFQVNGPSRVISAKHIHVLVLVAGGNEFLKPQLLEVVREVMEEITHSRIVAVTVDYLSLKVLFVVLQLPLNVRELGIKLVLLRTFRLMQILIFHSYIIS